MMHSMKWLLRIQRKIAFVMMRRADRRLVLNALSSGHNFANVADRLRAVSLRRDMEQ